MRLLWGCPHETTYAPTRRHPASYDALTLPSSRQLLALTALVLGLFAAYTVIIGKLFPPSNDFVTLMYTLVGVGILPVAILLLEPKQIPRRLLGEFRFRPWHIAAHATVRSVTRLTVDDNALANQADRLAGSLMPGDYLAEVEVMTSWADFAPKYITYIKVDRVFAEACHSGMSVAVRYQVSRLHPSRLRIMGAL